MLDKQTAKSLLFHIVVFLELFVLIPSQSIDEQLRFSMKPHVVRIDLN